VGGIGRYQEHREPARIPGDLARRPREGEGAAATSWPCAYEAFQRSHGFKLPPGPRRVYEEALATVAGPEFERAANTARNAEPDAALTAALAD
jgi:hypothetical protein